jgi:hypothetical protein
VSAAELCPENHCTGHKLLNNIWVVKCKFHMLVMLEYYYWWRGSWLLEKWSQCVCRRVLFLIFRCRFDQYRNGNYSDHVVTWNQIDLVRFREGTKTRFLFDSNIDGLSLGLLFYVLTIIGIDKYVSDKNKQNVSQILAFFNNWNVKSERKLCRPHFVTDRHLQDK